jgi:hypothetical protein
VINLIYRHLYTQTSLRLSHPVHFEELRSASKERCTSDVEPCFDVLIMDESVSDISTSSVEQQEPPFYIGLLVCSTAKFGDRCEIDRAGKSFLEK